MLASYLDYEMISVINKQFNIFVSRFFYNLEMPLLKFYNRNSNQNIKINERVITPNSIPIFILPPTLDSCRKSSQKNQYLSYSTRKLHF